VNRIVEDIPEPHYDGDTLVLPILEEVLVVEKRLILREEVRITPVREEVRDPQTHTVRREHVDVERVQ
jgi:stress response protein YsnF